MVERIITDPLVLDGIELLIKNPELRKFKVECAQREILRCPHRTLESPKCGDCSILNKELKRISKTTKLKIQRYTDMRQLIVIKMEIADEPFEVAISGYDPDDQQVQVRRL